MKKTLLSFMTLVFFVCSFLAKAQNPLPVCKIKAKFDFKTERCTVKFADFSAAASGTTITTWHWDFGDATTSTLQNPVHAYTTAGTYTVCLTITGVNNTTGLKCKDQVCLPVTVQGCGEILPCKLTAKFDFKTDGCKAAFMDYSATAAGTTIVGWYWEFGDGATSSLQNPSHAYTASETYTVCLTIVGINAAGLKCKDKICQKINIKNCGQAEPCKLAAKFDFKIDKCNIYFTDLSATGIGTTITNWYWDFGDGNTSNLQNPTHTYAAAGTYPVCLIIVGSNEKGEQCKDKFCTKLTVEGCGPVLPCGVKPLFDFKVDKCTVYFTDNSGTNPGTTITNWAWDFGDGTASALQHPTHTYATNGTYTVCLTTYAVNTAGEKCKNTYCFPVKIEGCGQTDPCGVKPLFDFKIDKCNVYFVDNSGTNTGTVITSWYWNFGDGNTSTLQHPTHTYAANGTYTVCLTAYAVNAAGVECKNTYCFPVKIEGCEQGDPCGVKPLFEIKIDKCTVNFVDNSGTNTGTVITSWYWDFGDGNTSTLQNPIHTYAANGTYTVCLTAYAVNAAGVECKNTYCKQVIIEGCASLPCKVGPKFSYKIYKCDVYFSGLSSNGAGTITTNWYWDFGDGNTSTLQSPTHAYAAAGTYEVCLTVVGTTATGEQCKDTYCEKLDVRECTPSECLIYPKFDFKIEKCTVYFTDYSSVGSGSGAVITNWYWDFGDGNTSNLQNPSHVYAANGVYKVCLIIVGVNAAGQECKDQLCLEIKIDGCGDQLPCIVGAKFDYKVEKCSVYFTDYSGTSTGTVITNWYWDFGDGNTSNLQNPSHMYAANGVYKVCLTIVGVNAAGQECKDQVCLEIKIDGCGDKLPCNVGAKFDYKVEKCSVYFTDYSGVSTGTVITNWYWDFGDGNTSTLQNPSHVYAANGVYKVCLTIVGVNAAGQECKDQLCLEIKIDGCGDQLPCIVGAKFDYKVEKCSVYFTDYSGTSTGTVITNWYWTFGDGSTSTLQNPVHVYTASGSYEVCLIVYGKNAAGLECKEEVCKKVLIDCCKEGIVNSKTSISAVEVYPNPAQGIVNIQFKLEAPEQVNITITDIQGRILSVIQDGNMTAGFHKLNWNADVRSGLYFIMIKTNAGIEQKQLVIQE